LRKLRTAGGIRIFAVRPRKPPKNTFSLCVACV
jgi:hypothetical protein